MVVASEPDGNIQPLVQRYHFFLEIYKHHCNAEDENKAPLQPSRAQGKQAVALRISGNTRLPLLVAIL
ncbi:hypothetical protein FRX31_014594 [Thalictrum thalictroides]|uniref:Uncharacterized protein n=1 Tax=Thalictrum thalictroides TaxID=46969 RepID=A0A7J6WEI0_THATH|nr:hypothetical protein FRX31_014594 [Thalictrum thalictroides]